MANHLTMAERDRIAQLRHQGADQKEIAKALNRSPATISRELCRNRASDEYFAAQAQEKSQQRRRERPLTRKMDDPHISQTVRHALTQYWSPEQIAGRLELDQPEGEASISARTIYQWIHGDPYRTHWESFLRRRGKRPFRRTKPAGIGAPIAQRPEAIEQRLRLGDFEGDTVLGPPGTGGLATLVDRKSRYAIVVKIQSKEADHVHQKIKGKRSGVSLRNAGSERRREMHRQRYGFADAGNSVGADCRRIAAAQAAVRYVHTLRPCSRQVATTVSKRSTNCAPATLRVPKLFLRHRTACRRMRSAVLLVGSTPGTYSKVHKASSCCRISAQVPAVRGWAQVAPVRSQVPTPW